MKGFKLILFAFSIPVLCLNCSTDDPLWSELEMYTPSVIEEEKNTIENNDSEKYLSDIKLADPYILIDGDYYYAYGTYDSRNGFGVYKSSDLFYWEYVGVVLEKNNTTASNNFWAPEVYRIDDMYYMFYAADRNLYVAKSDSYDLFDNNKHMNFDEFKNSYSYKFYRDKILYYHNYDIFYKSK